jgi:hypothetical protein
MQSPKRVGHGHFFFYWRRNCMRSKKLLQIRQKLRTSVFFGFGFIFVCLRSVGRSRKGDIL